MAAKPSYEELEQRVKELEISMSCFRKEGALQEIRRAERKKAEEMLRERTAAILESIADTFYSVDNEWKFTMVNPAAERAFFGRPSFELLGKALWDLYPGLVGTHIQQHYLDAAEKYTLEHFEVQSLLNGRWYEVFMRGWKGGVDVYMRDITERKQAEEALRVSEEHLRTVIEASPLAIISLTPGGRVQTWNPAAEQIFGWMEEEVQGKISPVVSKDQRETFFAHLKRVTEGEVLTQVELTRYRKGGSPVEISLSAAPLHDKGGRVNSIIAIFEDITERKEMEERMRQAQKMEGIGTLAGGIAHDFNNILSPIMLHSEMAMEGLPPGSPLLTSLKEIYKAGERARDLVKQILTFARRKKQERIILRASLIVKETIKFLRSTIPTTIEIKYNFKTERDTIFADPTQINQIVMNLCTNAADAMPEKGGLIEVILDDEYIPPDKLKRLTGLNPGRYLKLSVSDTGSGIPHANLDKIIEPYYTTKNPGEGTGLGLAIIHGIVTNYEGYMEVESVVGRGTTFHVYLPLIEAETSNVSEQKAVILKGNERILFVDDEKVAIEAMQLMLERIGYRVTTRTSSVEALEAFRHNPEAFDLVITDMTMPNMSGKELAKELIAIKPKIPVIICTGFNEKINEERAKQFGISALVMKPIIMSEIANTIRKVLDKR